ncbi:hypothetical protein CONCODRAFT_78493, partial [Conidiobolus coronatus NRRL 28638]
MSRSSSIASPTKHESKAGNLRFPSRANSGDQSPPRSNFEEEQQQVLGGYMAAGRYCLRGNNISRSSSFSQHVNPHHALNERDFEAGSPQNLKTSAKLSFRVGSNSPSNNTYSPSTFQDYETVLEKRPYAGPDSFQDDVGTITKLTELAYDEAFGEQEARKTSLLWWTTQHILSALVFIVRVPLVILYYIFLLFTSPIGIALTAISCYFLVNCVIGPHFYPEFYPIIVPEPRTLKDTHSITTSKDNLQVIEEIHTTEKAHQDFDQEVQVPTSTFHEIIDQIVTTTEAFSHIPQVSHILDKITTQPEEYFEIEEPVSITHEEAIELSPTNDESSHPTSISQPQVIDQDESEIIKDEASSALPDVKQSLPEDFANLNRNAFIISEGTHPLYQFTSAPGVLSQLGLGYFERLLSNMGLQNSQKTGQFVLSDDHPDNHCFHIEAKSKITIELGEAVKPSEFKLKFMIPSTNQPAQKGSIPIEVISFYGLNLGREDKYKLKTFSPVNRPDLFSSIPTIVDWSSSTNVIKFDVDENSESSTKFYKQYQIQVNADSNLDLCISRANIIGYSI